VTISFFVAGIPAPGGSKKAFVGPTGKIVVLDDAKYNKPWRERVALAAREAYRGAPLGGPLAVRMEFFVLRPKSHFNTKGEVRRSAPKYPATRPDVLKLARSTEDALTGILWRDDAQTVDLCIDKCYCDSTGVLVKVMELEG